MAYESRQNVKPQRSCQECGGFPDFIYENTFNRFCRTCLDFECM
jgi:ribosomal protein S14